MISRVEHQSEGTDDMARVRHYFMSLSMDSVDVENDEADTTGHDLDDILNAFLLSPMRVSCSSADNVRNDNVRSISLDNLVDPSYIFPGYTGRLTLNAPRREQSASMWTVTSGKQTLSCTEQSSKHSSDNAKFSMSVQKIKIFGKASRNKIAPL